jgi:hypothetical protein
MGGRATGRDAARAIDALRRGWAVRVSAADGALRLMAVEGADAVTLADFDPAGKADILISAARGQTLKLANQIAAADPDMPVMIARAPWIDADVATAISDPVLDLASPLKGPFQARALAAPLAAKAALRLARLAGILPAYFALDGDGDRDIDVSVDAIDAYDDAIHLAHRRASTPAGVGCGRCGTQLPIARSPMRQTMSRWSLVSVMVAAGRPPAQRMSDRRCAGQPEMRLRPATARGACTRSPTRNGACCSICGRKGAALASSTNCAPMRCRIRVSTRSMPISAWALPSMRAIFR